MHICLVHFQFYLVFFPHPVKNDKTECSQCLNGSSSALKTGHNIFVSFLIDALKVQSQE